MFKDSLDKLRGLRYTLPFSGWWLSLKSWWITRETDYFPVFLLSGLAVVITIISIGIIQSTETQADNRQLTCLALNIYHEARGEPIAGQYAVAEVTLNRVASPHYPNTICEVVYQKNWDSIRHRYVGAFSWTEFEDKPELKKKEWHRAITIADAVYYQRQEPELDGALFYHARSIKPSWARKKTPVARIGRHIFYR
ncbi:MAG: cell wall hydrolase [Halobacteria archaeon]|nr:cell wall hydrolase [Halobacteria archaeon]